MAVTPIAPRAAAAAANAAAPVQSPCASRPRFAEVLRELRPAANGSPSPASPLRSLEAVERAQQRLDDILAQARSGRTFTGGELLALQAEAHRFSHTVEIASKVVEQGAQTVKQAVNTPV
jgi:hypothetical protein